MTSCAEQTCVSCSEWERRALWVGVFYGCKLCLWVFILFSIVSDNIQGVVTDVCCVAAIILIFLILCICVIQCSHTSNITLTTTVYNSRCVSVWFRASIRCSCVVMSTHWNQFISYTVSKMLPLACITKYIWLENISIHSQYSLLYMKKKHSTQT